MAKNKLYLAVMHCKPQTGKGVTPLLVCKQRHFDGVAYGVLTWWGYE